MTELKGKTAVITGAASGIGRALAERFAAEGMKLVLADIEMAPLEEVAAALTAGAAEVLTVETDVSKPEQVEALANAAFERFGAVHVLCNNAGIGGGAGFIWERSLNDWRWVINVNLFGVIHGIHAFLPRLMAQGQPAHIVNTASVLGLVPTPFVGPYGAAKHGVVSLSEALSQELAMAGSPIKVSILCPGGVKTRITEERNRPEDLPSSGKEPSPFVQAAIAHIKQSIEGGMEPSEISNRVVDAIRTNRLYILTHESYMQPIADRSKTILGA